jgi:hypothetical protein
LSTDPDSSTAASPTAESDDTEGGEETAQQTGHGKRLGNRRLQTIIVRPPGTDDPEERMGFDAVDSLGQFLVDSLEQDNLQSLELLAFSTDDAVVFTITPRVKYTDSSRLNKTSQTSLSSFDDSNASTPMKTVEGLTDTLEDRISADWEVAIGSVDLTPLGRGSVIGTRFLLEKNRGMTDPDDTYLLLFEDLVKQLHTSRKPFIAQSILHDASDDYHFTGRFAVLDPEFSVVTTDDQVAHLKTGRQFDVSELTHETGLLTNHDIPIRDFATPQFDSIKFLRRLYMEKSDSKSAVALHRGTEEFRDLLRRRRGSDSLYGELDLYGVISSDDLYVPHLGSLVPRYYSTSPFDQVYGRSAPRISVQQVRGPAPDHTSSIGVDVDAQVESESLHMLSGSFTHEALVRFTEEVLQRDLSMVEAVEQKSGEENPDLDIVTPEGPVAGEVEFKDKTKGGRTVLNYAQAKAAGKDVWFVAPTREDVEFYQNVLVQPWNNTRSDGARLYNSNRKIKFESGLKPVLPPDVNEAQWIIRDTSLTLQTKDGEVLATGSATQPIEDFDFETPRYESEHGHRILDQDGQTIVDGPTKSAVMAEYTEISVPVIPDDLYLVDGVKFMYPSGDSLEGHAIDPKWGYEGSKTDIYRNGLENFCDRYVVTGDEASIPYSEFQVKVQEFFDTFAEATPNKTHIGRHLPPEIEVDGTGVKEREIYVDWVIDPGLESPI